MNAGENTPDASHSACRTSMILERAYESGLVAI
jgi:hypothetical protein